MRASIASFAEFIDKFEPDPTPLTEAKRFISYTLNQIDIVVRRNEKSYAALRADMALLESKRGIAQAESVSKLTELGFVFIPLSCVASMFSMQVKPLERAVPFYAFIVAATLGIGLAYTVRLTVRSRSLRKFQRGQFSNIRDWGGLGPEDQIPTRVFLRYLLLRREAYDSGLPRLGLGFLCVLALIFPMAFLWKREHLDGGYKAVMTLSVLLFDIIVVLPFIGCRLPRLGLKRLRPIRKKRSTEESATKGQEEGSSDGRPLNVATTESPSVTNPTSIPEPSGATATDPGWFSKIRAASRAWAPFRNSQQTRRDDVELQEVLSQGRSRSRGES